MRRKRLSLTDTGGNAITQDALNADEWNIPPTREPMTLLPAPTGDGTVLRKMPMTKPTDVLSKLAGALGRRDEAPNVELARALAERPNAVAVATLVETLTNGTIAAQGDAIKVLYELGGRRPELLSPYVDTFVSLLATKNNRLHWGVLSALDTLGDLESARIRKHLSAILSAAERASVIGKDKAVSLICKLHANAKSKPTWAALVRLLDDAANNQFPSYAEQLERVAKGAERTELAAIVTRRLPLVPQPAKVKRLNATLARL